MGPRGPPGPGGKPGSDVSVKAPSSYDTHSSQLTKIYLKPKSKVKANQ